MKIYFTFENIRIYVVPVTKLGCVSRNSTAQQRYARYEMYNGQIPSGTDVMLSMGFEVAWRTDQNSVVAVMWWRRASKGFPSDCKI